MEYKEPEFYDCGRAGRSTLQRYAETVGSCIAHARILVRYWACPVEAVNEKANNPVECLPTFTVRLSTVRLGKRDEVSHERNK